MARSDQFHAARDTVNVVITSVLVLHSKIVCFRVFFGRESDIYPRSISFRFPSIFTEHVFVRVGGVGVISVFSRGVTC